jgi:hypothetical protein
MLALGAEITRGARMTKLTEPDTEEEAIA